LFRELSYKPKRQDLLKGKQPWVTEPKTRHRSKTLNNKNREDLLSSKPTSSMLQIPKTLSRLDTNERCLMLPTRIQS
jgi:hypothetical protein